MPAARIRKTITLLVMTVLIVLASISFYEPATHAYQALSTRSYALAYLAFGEIESKPVPDEPAVAVPVLMYHGVVTNGELGANTKRRNFIKQMEMLKREGYETISVREYDLFRAGAFELPPKPIIITFDDGRKDSFYTVDEVFRKLGFSATIFVATGKANTDDPFYLNWDELRELRDTGRWEIEAHGQHSHDVVSINDSGDVGRFLSSRIYHRETGIESEAEYKDRVQRDYIAGMADIRKHLGIEPQYFAVPLNDYGLDETSHADVFHFNSHLTEQYFKLAFVQSHSDDGVAFESFYNYIDSDPHTLKRLEVKNMTAAELQTALDKFAPSEPSLVFPEYTSSSELETFAHTYYGSLHTTNTDILITPGDQSRAALVVFGDSGWSDYELTTQLNAADVTDSRIIIYRTDEDNLLRVTINAGTVRVIERVDGKETGLASAPLPDGSNPAALALAVGVLNNQLSLSINDTEVITDVAVTLRRGAPALGLWDPEGDSLIVWHFSVVSLKPVHEMI